jgi:hypothetical protein
VIATLLLALAATRQEDPTERQLRRLREQLQLTEEQSGKVKDLLKKQQDELRGLLTDEQKKRLDEGGGDRGRGGPPAGRGPGGGSWLPSTDELKTRLGLSDDQVSKVNEIRDGVRQQIRDFFRNRGRGGNPGDEWAAFESKARTETVTKINGVLTDEQKPKFDEIVKAAVASTPTDGGRRGGGVEDRVNRAMEGLKIADPKEADAIKGLVTKVATLMEKLEGVQRDSRGKVEEISRNADLSDDAVGERIGELLKGLRDLEKELTAARRELTDVVTNRQELELLRRGILR